MRKRFEVQLSIGQLQLSELLINPKSKNALEQLIAALKAIYCHPEYNEKLFSVLEKSLSRKSKKGRPGMNLWVIFVLAQVRMVLNCSYEFLHHLANNDRLLRVLLGVERDFGFERIEYEYQNIYDNVSGLEDEMLKEINEVIVGFGHAQVFKKKEETALRLKADSFVVESNVHFPTDYNLLWDCARKSLDT
ncbi:MAG: ISNCY family transposase, partial [Candidatus Symbiothrix sp.]|nr:ISNCY family transposase [Candidatus Symbiothrix sp.]